MSKKYCIFEATHGPSPEREGEEGEGKGDGEGEGEGTFFKNMIFFVKFNEESWVNYKMLKNNKKCRGHGRDTQATHRRHAGDAGDT